MKVLLEYELVTFFASILTAIIIGIFYDFLRAVRGFLKGALFWDIVMWILTLLVLCFGWFFVAKGIVRWYMVAGLVFSGIIYFLSLSKYVLFCLRFVVGMFYSFFSIFFKILLTPPRFLCKIIGVYIGKAKSKFSKKAEKKYDEKKA